MIIIIFILTRCNSIILKLNVFYKDILEIINNKYYLKKYVPFIPFILKIQKFIFIIFYIN
jgi:hypothetical protein